MSEGRVLFDGGIKSQSIDAVKSMIEFFDHKACEKLPAKVQLANGWQLTRSGKGDCYYMTSPRECSCPGFHYQRTCRHVASLAGQKEKVLPVLLADVYAFDTTVGEIEYWREKEQKKEMLSPSQELARNIVEAMEA